MNREYNYEYSGEKIVAANQNAKERDYWLEKLSGELQKSGFPYDHSRTDIHRKREHETTIMKTFAFELTGELFSLLVKISHGIDHTLHVILTAGVVELLSRYTYRGGSDIIVGTPIYKQEEDDPAELINTVLALRLQLQPREKITFKQLLVQMRETVIEAVENRNYPIEILVEKLNLTSPGHGFPLFDTAVLLENIHHRAYLQHIPLDMIFSFSRTGKKVDGKLEYNSLLYQTGTVEGIARHLKYLLEQALSKPDIPLSSIDTFPGEEKEQLVCQFNDTAVDFPSRQTIVQWFEEQAATTPDHTAVRSPIDLHPLYRELESRGPGIDPHPGQMLETCCFKKSPFLYRADTGLTSGNKRFNILKTLRHNSVVVNRSALTILDLFDGTRNVKTIFSALINLDLNIKAVLYPVKAADILEVTFDLGHKAEIVLIRGFDDFAALVKIFCKNHLLDLVGIDAVDRQFSLVKQNRARNLFDVDDDESPEGTDVGCLLNRDNNVSKARVLLLGDTPGMPSTGLLYLASYLRRNGIPAVCRFYDAVEDYSSLKKSLEEALEKIQPRIAAVSLKWFLYISRVLEICKIVKAYCPDIKIVVGGNTAAYYWQDMIQYQCIDYIVRGDGELPLLEICQQEKEENIPNLVYRKDGKITANPIDYVQDETHSSDIYLSHLDDILISAYASIFGTFFIYTHKGCVMNCLYCGGCREAQVETFNRQTVLRRGVREVRKDILEAQKFTSTFQFDFDTSTGDRELLNYCRDIWEGIDLSDHFCIITTMTTPTAVFIEHAARTFKYVYWDLDVSTLSERHRMQLSSMGLVKPQPCDADILVFLDECEKHGNIEVRLNLITGLPYLTPDDFEPGEKLLSHITDHYSCFGGLHWARLHAQPGAPLVKNPGKHRMHSYAVNFQDFLTCSEKNVLPHTPYPGLEYLNYPYIYFKNDELNSKVTAYYSRNNLKIRQHGENKAQAAVICEELSYWQLNQTANQLAGFLKAKGITPDTIAGIMLEPSLRVMAAILGILKAGGAYLPIDPGTPEKRLKRMIGDAAIGVLVSQKKYIKTLNRLQWECPSFHTFICLDSTDIQGEEETEKSELMNPQLWDSVAERAVDDITAGAWLSGYTGEPLSRKEMDEYSDNVSRKLSPFLNNQTKVLEIGCASGLTMYCLAPNVGLYYGTDLSAVIIEKNRERVIKEGHGNIRLACVPAHEIDTIEERDFDLVIFNSVIQSFHSHHYLRNTIAKVVNLLGPRGHIFVGDVMDLDLKENLIREMKDFQAAHRDKNYKTKTDWSIELFVSRAFFEDLAVDIPQIREAAFSDKIHTIENELTRFRYDCLLTVDKTGEIPVNTRQKHKYQEDASVLEHYSPENPGPASASHHLAYVIYTSGTSGIPKGVLLKNENLVNYVQWFSSAARLGHGYGHEDAALLTSSTAFDLGYTSLFSSILNGIPLHIVPREIYLSASRFLNYIEENRITYLKLTPSLFSIIVNHPGFAGKAGKWLRLVVLGGEAIDVTDVEKAHALCPDLQIINHYGPTEAAIGCAAQYIDFNRFDGYKEKPSIGKPIANCSAYILDQGLNLLPIGVPGELCISGVCLARGYLNQPELTAEKFDQDLRDYQDYQDEKKETGKNKQKLLRGVQGGSFLEKSPPGRRRLYKTGDLARWLSDGNIEFLGRIDQQVKIRGYRVELEEIEKRLSGHPDVEDAAAVVRENSEGEKYLCAYIVPGSTAVDQGGVGMPQRDEEHSILTDEEKVRYSRQMLLDGWGTASQEKLKRTTVFVAGAGGGASPTLTQLALAGIGTIIVCDYDTVELSNLNRQFLHDESRIGMNKAISAKMSINRINPNVNVIALREKITGENVSQLVGNAAVIFDMLDDLEGKFILSGYAAGKQIPHIAAAMIELNSYAVIFNPPQTPCLHCLFDKKKFTELDEMKELVKDYEKKPLHVTASSLFVSTGFVVTEALKILLGFENPGYNKFFLFNQGASQNIVNTDGYRMMTYPFSDHFKRLCKQQGFDWDEGWRGRFLEELEIEKDPNCPICSTLQPLPKEQDKRSVEKKEKTRKKDFSSLSSELREYLLEELPEYMIPSQVIQLEKIPLTPNGKVDRRVLPAPGIKCTVETHAPPENDTEEKLVEVWSEVLGIECSLIGIDDNFFEIGLDSIKAIQVSAKMMEHGLKVELRDIFSHPTIRQLAGCITPTHRAANRETVEGDVPLTPIQQWFFENYSHHPHHFNMAVMLHREEGFSEDFLDKVFSKLVEHHDALRMVFSLKDGSVIQRNRGITGKFFDLEIFCMENREGDELEAAIRQETDRLQGSIDLQQGPLLKLGLFRTGQGDHLSIILHHLIVDGISWGILLEDFAVGYKQALEGKPLVFPGKTDSFRYWSRRLTRYAQSSEALKESAYWKNLEEKVPEPLPRDTPVPGDKKKVKFAEILRMELEPEKTRGLLKEVNRAYNTEINDILLAALGLAIKEWTGIGNAVVALEGHGRENIMDSVDISRTVGWFTSQFPVILDMNQTSDLSLTIKSVKETLRKIPNKGIGYGILRYLTPPDKKQGTTFNLEPEINFNYFGRFDGENQNHIFKISGMSTGDAVNPESPDHSALGINAMITAGTFILSVTYNKFEFEKKRIQKLVDLYKSYLIKIIDHCRSKEKKELTPSDLVDDEDLSIEELESIREFANLNIDE